MQYHETLSYLYGLRSHGIKLGLDNITALLASLGNPQRAFPSVHVAGTNGKGSVSAMVASILRRAGYKAGLFTSPHLVSFTERICVDSRAVTEEEVIGLAEEVRHAAAVIDSGGADGSRPFSPTFFEVVTAMAMLHFARNGVDWGVIEVGMGGRLDATNTVDSRATVITRIHVDHPEFLGATIGRIARDKTAIMRPGIPVVTAPQEKEAIEVIEQTARDMSCPLMVFGRDFSGRLLASDLRGITFDFDDGVARYTNLFAPLPGGHQFINACVAVKACITALGAEAPQGPPLVEVIREGLAAVRWPGRIEIIDRDPLVILDGAHNPDGARTLADFASTRLREYRIILIFGIMGDKDIKGVLGYLMPITAEIVTCAPRSGRSAPPGELARLARDAGFEKVHIAHSVESALIKAKDIARRSDKPPGGNGRAPLILVAGSLYTVGEVKTLYGERPVLGRLREYP